MSFSVGFLLLLTWTVASAKAGWAQQWTNPAAYGVYVNANAAGSARGDALVDELVTAGGNAVVFDVKDRLGRLSYTSKVALARAIRASGEATIDRPVELVGSWRDRGVYVIARLTCFHDVLLALHHQLDARPPFPSLPLALSAAGPLRWRRTCRNTRR